MSNILPQHVYMYTCISYSYHAVKYIAMLTRLFRHNIYLHTVYVGDNESAICKHNCS